MKAAGQIAGELMPWIHSIFHGKKLVKIGVHGSGHLGTQAGILGEYVQSDVWAGHKFAIDIDGNSNAWANLFCRLLLGCCIIKVQSPGNFRQWYYDPTLTPPATNPFNIR